MPTQLLATKVRIPLRRPSLVAHPRLIDRLDDARRLTPRLVLVSAPAGSGKSVLMSDCVPSLVAQPHQQFRASLVFHPLVWRLTP